MSKEANEYHKKLVKKYGFDPIKNSVSHVTIKKKVKTHSREFMF